MSDTTVSRLTDPHRWMIGSVPATNERGSAVNLRGVVTQAASLALAPLYAPVCLGMWLLFVATDIQGNTDDMVQTGIETVERIFNYDGA